MFMGNTGFERNPMRKWVPVWLLIQAAIHGEVIRFDRTAEGSLPSGWTVAMTHAGAPPKWEIVRDDSAPHPPLVLAEVSRDATAGRFPLAIWERALLRNGEVSVAFKPVDGGIDRAAGVVWRYQDPNNYYIARANALENNVVLYKVENGTRLSIAPKGAAVAGIRCETRSSERRMEHASCRLQGQLVHGVLQWGTPFRH